ncbi:MAG: hypothetical protein WD669_05615 [Pirellulales bacterium]
MLLDFEVQRSTRRCAATGQPLEPGDVCYSMLEVIGPTVIRKDYCGEAWGGPSAIALGWWRSRVPEPAAKKIKLAPNDVLLELFDQLAEHPERQDMRYVLALLLLRRRVLRLEVSHESPGQPAGQGSGQLADETMDVYCPQRDASYCVPIVMPGDTRIDEIQQQLSELLIADAE